MCLVIDIGYDDFESGASPFVKLLKNLPRSLTSKMNVEANSAAASLINGGKRKRTAMAKTQ